MIRRDVQIEKNIKKGKTLIVFGARRTGKTTLLEDYIEKHDKKKIVKYNGDNLSVQRNFSVNEGDFLGKMVAGYDVLVIDEAQNIKNIGKSLKILNDERKDLAVVVSGSSSFELRGQIGEPLVGRKTTIFLYPLSVGEILRDFGGVNVMNWEKIFEQLLVFGTYPDSVIAENDREREEFLMEYVDSLLFKDILAFQEVKGSDVLLRLLRLLAFQVGDEVSVEELGKTLGISKNTVARYLDLLEKAFVIFRMEGFSRNLRNEINKKSKYYFFDVGVRNAVIKNFNEIEARDDLGRLWENFVVVERRKALENRGEKKNLYFWRTWEGSEIDLLEEKNGKFEAFEMKWNEKKKSGLPKQWTKEYGEIPYRVVNRGNFLEEIFG